MTTASGDGVGDAKPRLLSKWSIAVKLHGAEAHAVRFAATSLISPHMAGRLACWLGLGRLRAGKVDVDWGNYELTSPSTKRVIRGEPMLHLHLRDVEAAVLRAESSRHLAFCTHRVARIAIHEGVNELRRDPSLYHSGLVQMKRFAKRWRVRQQEAA